MTKQAGPPKKAEKSNQTFRRVLLILLIVVMLILLSVVLNLGPNRSWPVAVQAQTRVTSTLTIINSDDSFLAQDNSTPGDTGSPSDLDNNSTPTATETPFKATVPPPTSTQTQPIPPVTLEANSTNDFQGTIYLSINENGYNHLFAYHPTSTAFTRLTNGSWDDITPSPSPDGKLLAFSSNRDGPWDLYLLDLSTGSTRRLTDTPEYDASPSWSPDNQWLVYESYVLGPQSPRLELVDSHNQPLANEGDLQPTPESDRSLDLLILPVEDSLNRVAETIRLTSDPGAEYAPVWSPTGRQIAFVSAKNGDHEIWVADLDRIDDRFRNISRNPSSADRYPAWAPQDSALSWVTTMEGIQNIAVLDDINIPGKSRKIGSGNHPTWDPSGKFILTIFSSPNHNYLTGYNTKYPGLIIPPVLLPGPSTALSWGAHSLPLVLPQALVKAAEVTPTPLWNPAISPVPDSPNERHRIVELDDMEAPYAMLHDLVDEAYFGLRNYISTKVDWDYLATLENAFVPLTSPLFPGMLDDWLYTGRAISLNTAPVNANWVVVMREDFGTSIYWRVFVRTRFQDGSQGRPLVDFPWDFNARYSGDPRHYEQGGAYENRIPEGYWLDFTEIALSLGWERLPALASWKTAYNAARHNEFIFSDGLDWITAMQEIYPADALATPTKVVPPTHTPTATRWPTLTPTPTRTPWPSRTPTPTRTPTNTLIPPTPTP